MNIRCSCGRTFEASVDTSVPEVVVHCPSCGQELRVRNHKAAAAAMSHIDNSTLSRAVLGYFS